MKSFNLILTAGLTVQVEVANTPSLQQTGLLKYAEIHDNQAMWFPYAYPSNVVFHTMGMKFPIDIVAFGPNRRIIEIVSNAEPGIRAIRLDRVAGVLELPSGFCNYHSVKVGQRLIKELEGYVLK